MRLFILVLLLFFTGCTVPQPEPVANGSNPVSTWKCDHLYAPEERSYTFYPDSIEIVKTLSCPSIVINKGKCPTYVKIEDVDGETVWLTQDEWENYTCKFQENSQ